jgi:Fe2+ or Zn2+ uptake regulation protein
MNYNSLLKSYNLKVTQPRIKILQLIDKRGHIAIDDIYNEISQIYEKLSLATVYKNILTMRNIGLIIEIPIIGKKTKYELTKKSHLHFICKECGIVEDKEICDNLKDIFKTIALEDQFIISSLQNNIYGLCLKCQ